MLTLFPLAAWTLPAKVEKIQSFSRYFQNPTILEKKIEPNAWSPYATALSPLYPVSIKILGTQFSKKHLLEKEKWLFWEKNLSILNATTMALRALHWTLPNLAKHWPTWGGLLNFCASPFFWAPLSALTALSQEVRSSFEMGMEKKSIQTLAPTIEELEEKSKKCLENLKTIKQEIEKKIEELRENNNALKPEMKQLENKDAARFFSDYDQKNPLSPLRKHQDEFQEAIKNLKNIASILRTILEDPATFSTLVKKNPDVDAILEKLKSQISEPDKALEEKKNRQFLEMARTFSQKQTRFQDSQEGIWQMYDTLIEAFNRDKQKSPSHSTMVKEDDSEIPEKNFSSQSTEASQMMPPRDEKALENSAYNELQTQAEKHTIEYITALKNLDNAENPPCTVVDGEDDTPDSSSLPLSPWISTQSPLYPIKKFFQSTLWDLGRQLTYFFYRLLQEKPLKAFELTHLMGEFLRTAWNAAKNDLKIGRN